MGDLNDIVERNIEHLARHTNEVISSAFDMTTEEIIENAKLFKTTIYPDGRRDVAMKGVRTVRFWPLEIERGLEDGSPVVTYIQKHRIIEHN